MLSERDDVRLPFSVLDSLVGDVFSVRWEPEMMGEMGNALKILTSEVLSQVGQTVLQATAMTALMSALQWPISASSSVICVCCTFTESPGLSALSSHQIRVSYRQSMVQRTGSCTCCGTCSRRRPTKSKSGRTSNNADWLLLGRTSYLLCSP